MTRLLSATEARDYVMQQHEQTKAAYLYVARSLAVKIAKEKGQVTINDVRRVLPPPEGMHPSVLGAVFRNKVFQHTGRYTTADHAASHARKVGIYTVKEK